MPNTKKDNLIASFEAKKKEKEKEKDIILARHIKELTDNADVIDTFDLQIKALKKYKL